MSNKSKAIIAVGIVGLLAAATVISRGRGGPEGRSVRVEEVGVRDLFEFVEASGNIRAVKTVDISSDVSAKVASVLIEEGDYVTRGQILIRLEPQRYQAAVDRTEAALAQAESGLTQQKASLQSSQRALARAESLRARGEGLVSEQQLEDARTQAMIAAAQVSAAEHGVGQAAAAVDEAREELAKTVFTAPMNGRVTRLNVEEGETVIIGTMNNPGSLVLTISDLSVMEVVVKVDETNVPAISIDDEANVRIDAFLGQEFAGRVTEIGNSAIVPPSQQSTGTQAAIDFEVVITLDPTDVELRPDLSATAEIITERREEAVAIPFISLTARDPSTLDQASPPDSAGEKAGSDADGDRPTAARIASDEEAVEEVEGVFLVVDGVVSFTLVEVGITARDYFEVLSGVSVGDSVVAGPYQSMRLLSTGDAVTPTEGPVVGN